MAHMRAGPELISRFDVDQITTEALLFQSGYLTIKEQETLVSGMVRYTLGYPNLEVEFALNTCLLNAYTSDASASDQLSTRLYDLLQAGDVAGLPVSLIGVEFSRESRNVVGFEVAQLG